MEERLLSLLRHYELTPSSFADKIGVQRSSISHLLSGRNKPSFDFIKRLIENFPDVDIKWFISGKGNIINTVRPTPVNLSLFDQNDFKFNESEKEIPIEHKTSVKNGTNINSLSDHVKDLIKPEIKRIVIFYDDKTWEEFIPNKT